MAAAPVRFINAAAWPLTIWTSLTHLDDHPADDYSGVPEERIKHNFFVRMRTLGLLPEHTRSWMEAHSYEVRSLFFRDWNDLFAKGTGDAWFMDTTETLSREYAEFYEREFYDELNRYRLDYVILEGETPFYVIEAMRLGESIQAGSFRIYRFRP